MTGLSKGILAAIGALAAGAATAADLPTKKAPPPPPAPLVEANPWRVDVIGYGWLSSITGDTGFGIFPTLPYYAPFWKVLQHLQFAAASAVTAHNGTYIVGIDAFYSKIGGSSDIQADRLPAGYFSASLALQEAWVTAFGGLRIPIGSPNLELYGTVGARYMFSGTSLTLSTASGIGTTESVNKGWINPVVGIAGTYKFDDKWSLNMLADIGGWSDSATGQALASLQYNWTSNFATTLGYRVMYNYEEQDTGWNYVVNEPRSFRYQQWLYGPVLGLKFSF